MKTLDQLEDNLAAVGWSLTEEEMERFENCTEASSYMYFFEIVTIPPPQTSYKSSRLDAASALPAPYPYEMINRLNKDRRRI